MVLFQVRLQQQEYTASGLCNPNLLGKAYIAQTGYLGLPIREMYLPDMTEVVYDVPLNNFDCVKRMFWK